MPQWSFDDILVDGKEIDYESPRTFIHPPFITKIGSLHRNPSVWPAVSAPHASLSPMSEFSYGLYPAPATGMDDTTLSALSPRGTAAFPIDDGVGISDSTWPFAPSGFASSAAPVPGNDSISRSPQSFVHELGDILSELTPGAVRFVLGGLA